MRTRMSFALASAFLLLMSLAACGGGGGGGEVVTPTYSVGGAISGLTGTGLVLRNNGGDDLSITTNATFTFSTKVAVGGAYAVTVKTHPASQSCFVTNGTGTVAAADVTNVAVACYAASGSLDAGFGTGGLVSTPVGSTASLQAVALQSDGKIVAAGDSTINGKNYFALVRYNTDGSLDPAFGTSGIVTAGVGTFGSRAMSVIVQPDQMIVVAGSTRTGLQDNLALVRYKTDGTPDPSFGASGLVSTPVGTTSAWLYALAVQTDGRIIAAGYRQGSTYDGVLVRYLSDGSLDTTFGTGGKVILDVGTYDLFYALALQPDGKILVAGTTNYNDYLLVRYLADGTLDTTFGTNGIVRTDIAGSGQDFATDMIRQPDGKIILAGGTATTPGLFDYSLVRYNENGSIDSAFGTNGVATAPILCNNDFGAKVALQSDGKIVITAPGSVTGAAPHDTIIVRYMPSGSLDAGFGSNGKVNASMGALSDIPYAITIQADGRIIVAGVDNYGGNSNFALLRINP